MKKYFDDGRKTELYSVLKKNILLLPIMNKGFTLMKSNIKAFKKRGNRYNLVKE